ncbi:TIM44-like domain-containing protein [Acuticoccus sp. MNP-M23]|uniref:Tim44 domain-containing protein n=1 Tax=Acuticoccus sp. MNP-M23 TaxID=3072793 RepID=UPI0028162972|nr:TIM44-like domain-containing protein [Acuticoccus sp. MNP-M23]WMS42332.1 TIM44-like domain-containing protein [Acuticoccus sp. MNP-M23]
MRALSRLRGLVLLAILSVGLTLVATDFAEARRGGGFGSRGARTFSTPAPTRTAPKQAQPVNRSMTPQQQSGQPGAAGATRNGAAAAGQRGGMFGGMMGGLLGGLMLGGLIGMMFGGGLGGMAGFLGLILQVGIVILVVSLLMRYFRSKKEPALAGASGARPQRFDFESAGSGMGAAPASSAGADAAAIVGDGTDEIGITNDDLEAFEQLLVEIQASFTREDYAGLRARSTPEIVSFLSEELSENAVNGVRNDVTDVKLLQGDLAEAWRENNDEYATVAMRYESVDVMRDRNTGAIADGDAQPSETIEVWTFVRPVGGDWKLSAIQDV